MAAKDGLVNVESGSGIRGHHPAEGAEGSCRWKKRHCSAGGNARGNRMERLGGREGKELKVKVGREDGWKMCKSSAGGGKANKGSARGGARCSSRRLHWRVMQGNLMVEEHYWRVLMEDLLMEKHYWRVCRRADSCGTGRGDVRHRWDIEGVEFPHPVSVTTGNLVQTASIGRLGWLPGGGNRHDWWQLECLQLRPCSLGQQRRLGRLGRRSELGQRWRICLLCTTRHGRLRG